MNSREYARLHLDPLDVMTRTLWAEARGEPEGGQRAVAWVIRNRAQNPRWWGTSVKDVCLKTSQFSCWNPSDPQSKRILSVDANSELYQRLYSICVSVLKAPGQQDPTNNSDHYLVKDIASSVYWSKNRTPEVILGAHAFYRLELTENRSRTATEGIQMGDGSLIYPGPVVPPIVEPLDEGYVVQEETPVQRTFWDRLFKRWG